MLPSVSVTVNMPRKYIRKNIKDPEKHQRLKDASQGVRDKLYTVSMAAKMFKVSKTTLLRHLKNKASDEGSEGNEYDKPRRAGNPFNLPKECEEQLAECLTVMAKWGFGLAPSEICDYVKQFVTEKKKEKSKVGDYIRKYCRFKDNRPGEDWVYYFLKRYGFSVKKASTLEKARKSAAIK